MILLGVRIVKTSRINEFTGKALFYEFACFKCVNGIATSHLCDVLRPKASIRTRESRSTCTADNLLYVPYVNYNILNIL